MRTACVVYLLVAALGVGWSQWNIAEHRRIAEESPVSFLCPVTCWTRVCFKSIHSGYIECVDSVSALTPTEVGWYVTVRGTPGPFYHGRDWGCRVEGPPVCEERDEL
jgi:hypothetical protein